MAHVLAAALIVVAFQDAQEDKPPTTPAAGMQLFYRGSVAEALEDGTAGEPQKTFEVLYLVSAVDQGGADLYWLVKESGRGGWPWIERFGRSRLDGHYQPSAETGPSLLYDRGDGTSPVELRPPLYKTDAKLAAAATWQQGGLEYEVGESSELEGRPVWEIIARDAYGRRHTRWLSRGGPLVVGIEERFFMGQGEQFVLEQRLAEVQSLSPERLTRAVASFDAMLELRHELNRPDRTEDAELNEDQIEILRKRLPELERVAAGGPLAELVRTARRDFTGQSGRADDVSALVARFEGRPVERFEIEGLRGAGLSRDELPGNVTILHFWDYRDEPLKEPYGQVGYLEFLYEQRRSQGLNIYGVAVDGRLADPDTRSASVRSISKLRSFMNLSYPVLLDDGALVKLFGDPRTVGARLPLFVVVGPQGHILHYKVGHYEVDRDLGLKELDRIVGEALSAGRELGDR